jgi:hypothetical protein
MHDAELLCVRHIVMVVSFHAGHCGHLLGRQGTRAHGEQRGGCRDTETGFSHAQQRKWHPASQQQELLISKGRQVSIAVMLVCRHG